MKFKKEFLLDEIMNTEAVVHTKIVDTSRWNIHYYMVFKHEGKLYGVYFSRGATEMQDEQPFEYDGDEIECDEVEAVQKTITVYEPVLR